MALDAEQFRELVVRHQSMVYSIALRMTGDPGTAEEVAQDVFVSLFRAACQPEGEEHLRFWLRRASTHGAIDAIRRKRRQPERGAEEWLEADFPTEADRENPDVERVEQLLSTLPEPQRVALVLRYGEELRPDEIAEVTGQPVATVKSHLQRGLAMLRRKAAVTWKEVVRGLLGRRVAARAPATERTGWVRRPGDAQSSAGTFTDAEPEACFGQTMGGRGPGGFPAGRGRRRSGGAGAPAETAARGGTAVCPGHAGDLSRAGADTISAWPVR